MPAFIEKACQLQACINKFRTTKAREKNGRGRYCSRRCVYSSLSVHYAQTTEERFWKKVRKTKGCWLWQGAKDTKGYGQLTINRKRVCAHRFSYTLAQGRIAKGAYILHSCDTPACVNPEHLKAGTQKDNMQDAKRKGRLSSVRAKGEAHYNARLSRKDVTAIRRSKNSPAYLSRKYGVSRNTIYAILSRRIWKSIP